MNWEKYKCVSPQAMQVLNTAGAQVCEPRGRFQEYDGFWRESLETPAIIGYIWPEKDRFWALLYQVNTSK